MNTSFTATCTSTTTILVWILWQTNPAPIGVGVDFNAGSFTNVTIWDFLLVLVSKSPYYVSTATLINVESGRSETMLSCASSYSMSPNDSATIALLVQGMSLLHSTHCM